MSLSLDHRSAELQPLKRSSIYWTFSDALVLAKRNLMQIPRIPELVVFATIQPVMFVFLFRYVFGGAIAIHGTSYVNYLMAGIFVQTLAFGSVATGIGLAEDLHRGIVDRFRSLPMARSAVLTGRTLADMVRNGFSVLVMLAVGLLVGFRPSGNLLQWAGAAGFMLLLGLSFSWIGATVGLMVRSVEAAQSAGFIWLFPLTFASSVFVQTSTMPVWLRGFASHQPISVITNSVRALLLNQPVGDNAWQALGWCGGILIIFVPLSVSLYRRATTK
jgi:ABC transporter DrrB family efflux protein